jgi:hypothetical protein
VAVLMPSGPFTSRLACLGTLDCFLQLRRDGWWRATFRWRTVRCRDLELVNLRYQERLRRQGNLLLLPPRELVAILMDVSGLVSFERCRFLSLNLCINVSVVLLYFCLWLLSSTWGYGKLYVDLHISSPTTSHRKTPCGRGPPLPEGVRSGPLSHPSSPR